MPWRSILKSSHSPTLPPPVTGKYEDSWKYNQLEIMFVIIISSSSNSSSSSVIGYCHYRCHRLGSFCVKNIYVDEKNVLPIVTCQIFAISLWSVCVCIWM